MADTVTVAGLIATPIKHTVTSDGLEISSFRLASSSRRYDRAAQAWVDGEPMRQIALSPRTRGTPTVAA